MGLKASHSESLWLYLAYISLLVSFLIFISKLSYLNVNVLLFRFFLIIASVWFILNGVLIGFIWLDVIMYNFLMIIINVIYSIPLIKPYLDVKLNDIEQRVYDNVFKKNIDKRTCKRILDKAILQYFPETGFIVQQKSKYEGVYLIAKLKASHELLFIEDKKEVFKETRCFSWCGIVEYDQMRKAEKEKAKTYKWPISILVEKKEEDIEDNDPLNENYDDGPVYVYFFKFSEIHKLYNEENGTHVRNALHSVWLESMTHKIIEIDSKVTEIMKRKNEDLEAARILSERMNEDIFEDRNSNLENNKENNEKEIYENLGTEDRLIENNYTNEATSINNAKNNQDKDSNKSTIKQSNDEKIFINSQKNQQFDALIVKAENENNIETLEKEDNNSILSELKNQEQEKLEK